MSSLLEALRAYQSYDPPGWVAVYRHLPPIVGLLLVAVGALLLAVGGGRTFRLLAAPLGLAVGLWATPLVLTRLGLATPDAQLVVGVGVGLFLLGVALPPAVLFVALGVPLGLVGGALVGSQDWLLGFAPGFLIGGAAGALGHRSVGSVVASLVGAWLLVLGLLTALDPVGTLAATVAQQPWGVLLAAGLLAVAGSIYQLAVRPSPEEAQRLREEKLRAKQRLAEKRALEKRWGKAP